MTPEARLRANWLDLTPEEAHHRVGGNTMEPDPANPGLMRQTAFCPFCVAHRPDEDSRWPCETARLLERVRLADAAAASMVSKANEALTLLYEMVQEPKFPIPANGPARTFLGYAPVPAEAKS